MMVFRVLASLMLFCSVPLIAKVHKINTITEYNAAFNSTRPMIAMYSSTSCGPCRIMKPSFIHASDQNPAIFFCLIDVENTSLQAVVDEHKIRSIPQVIFSCNGKKIMTERGSMGQSTLDESIENFRFKLKTIQSDKKKKETSAKAKKPVSKKAQSEKTKKKPEPKKAHAKKIETPTKKESRSKKTS